MVSDPRVTVLMSVYNGEKYLRKAIDSVLMQTYSDFEFLIYDDCSTDSSADIVASYCDPRVIFRRNAVNQGLTKNLADGVMCAHGEYIARMDADDIAYPERLAKQIAWMDEHRDVTILGSPVMYCDENGRDIGIAHQPMGDAAIKARLLSGFTLMHPTIMIRVDDLRNGCLNYNIDYRCSQDHALYFDCIMAGLKFENFPEPLLRMRSHKGSISRAQNATQRDCARMARERLLSRLGVSGRYSSEAVKAWHSIADGRLPDSLDALHAFDLFVFDFCNQSNVVLYFDSGIVLCDFANKLSGLIYQCASSRKGWMVALGYFRLRISRFALHWSVKTKLKFLIKILFSLARC